MPYDEDEMPLDCHSHWHDDVYDDKYGVWIVQQRVAHTRSYIIATATESGAGEWT